jgi:hypothetical protein
MMHGFKLTDQNGQTRGATQWGAGITHSIPVDKRKNEHCSDGVLHFYESLDLGLLVNPGHGNYSDPQIWTCKTPERIGTDGLKSWCYELQTLERVDMPSWYQNPTLRLQVIVVFARLCADVADIYARDAARYALDAARNARDAARYASDAARYARNARDAARYASDAAHYAASYASDARYASYARAAIDIVGLAQESIAWVMKYQGGA